MGQQEDNSQDRSSPDAGDGSRASREGRGRWLCGNLDGDAYDAYFERLARQGNDVHGEAAFAQSLGPRSVLDAGCGTGRVARELDRRGIEVVGVDIAPDMLSTAQRKSPQIEWRLGDLATVDLGRTFDMVLLAGNVMIFLQPGREGAVVQNMARHVAPAGYLVAGFQLDFSLTLDRYDALAREAGLNLSERWSTWDRVPWSPGDRFAVTVHRRP